MKIIASLLMIMALTCQSLGANAKSSQELYELSITANSEEYKEYLRTTLAQKDKTSAYGLFANAWVFSAKGDEAEAIRLYRQSIATSPKLTVSHHNLSTLLAKTDYKQAMQLKKSNTELAVANNDPEAEYYYRNLHYDQKNGPEKARLLQQYKYGNNAQRIAYFYLNSVTASNNGDTELALEQLLLATELGYSVDILTRLMKLKMMVAQEQGADRNAKIQVLVSFRNIYRQAIANNELTLSLQELAFDIFGNEISKLLPGSYSDINDARYEAFMVRRSPAMAIKYARNLAIWGKVEQAKEEYYAAIKRDPTFFFLQFELAWFLKNFEWSPQESLAHGALAIKHALLPKTKSSQLYYQAIRYRDFANEQAGIKLLLKHLPQQKNHDGHHLYDGLIALNISLQKYDAADNYLREATELGMVNRDFEKYRDLIDVGLLAQKDKRQYLKNNPFLLNWDSKFAGELSLAIEFSTNSAKIPSSAFRQLDKAAAALTAEGSDNYIFTVEGHTDSTGSNTVNIPLSKRRAESVKRYFFEKHKIPEGRLQTTGYGSTQPITTNNTIKGKQRNRRVDIKPYGNVSNPEVAVAANLNTHDATFSKDGRYMATGSSPITLWDLKEKLKIREFSTGAGVMRAFSPNGRYLAALSNRTTAQGLTINAIYVSDVKTGLVENIITLTGSDSQNIKFFSWSPYSDQLVYITRSGLLRIFDINKGRTVASTLISKTRIGGVVKWLSNGKHIVVGQSQREVLHVYLANDLSKVTSTEGLNWPHAIGESFDGSRLIVFNNDSSISLFDSASFELLQRVKNEGPIPRRVIAVPGSTQFILDSKFRQKAVSIFDYSTMSYIARESYVRTPYIGMNADGSRAYVATGEKLLFVDPKTLKVIDDIESTAYTGKNLLWDKANDLLLSEGSGGTSIWSIKDARRVHSIGKDNHLLWRSVTKQGSEFISITKEGQLLSFDTHSFSVKKHAGVDYEPTMLTISGDYIVVVGREHNTERRTTGTEYITVFNKENYQKSHQIDVGIVNQPVRYDVRRGGISSISVNPVQKRIAVSTWWNDGDSGNVYSKTAQIFNLNTGAKKSNVVVRDAIRSVSLTDISEDYIKVSSETHTYLVNTKTKKTSDRQRKQLFEIEIQGQAPLLWDRFKIQHGQLSVSSKEWIASVLAFPERNFLLVLTSSNKIIYYSLKDLRQRLVINDRKNDQWLAYTPDGYFTASLHGTDGVYWSFGDRFLPFNAMKQRFEKPQVIVSTLSKLFAGQTNDQDKPVIEADVLDLPFNISLVGDSTVNTKDDSHLVKLRIEKLDKNNPDPDFFFTINGRKTRGFNEEPFYDGDEALFITRNIPLGIGENIVEANLVYRGVVAHTERVVITRQAERNKDGDELAKLWFFGVGVSEYQKSVQNLDFAHRDAIELAKVFKQQQGKLFANVHTKILVNAQAKAREIQIEMNDFLRQAAPDDHIVIFIAGHGIQDKEQNLYFMPHDGDLKRPYTGMRVADFRDFLDRRPINQKALFLMDICHAGSVGKGNLGRLTSEDAIKKLSEGTATTVLASSSGAQQSFEDENFGGGHGAFTHAIIEALKGKGDSEMGDLDGYTSLLEMIMYTYREVPRLTKRAQKPSIPKMDNFEDYLLSQSSSN